MTTRQRIELLARAYPRLFPRAELTRLVREQLGDVDALDRWSERDGVRARAQAPKLICHICAGNLAISGITSVAHGLILGSQNIVKLPGDRHDSSARSEIIGFVRGLPAPLHKLVQMQRKIDDKLLRFGIADAIVAFGTGETIADIKMRTLYRSRFIAHGPATSLLWIEDDLSPRMARACATDVLTYDQLGCLSPQAIYVAPGTAIATLGDQLARALEAQWRRLSKKPARPLGVAARIGEARDVAFARGHRTWLPPSRHLGWTLIYDPDPTFAPSPLHGVIAIRKAGEALLAKALAPVANRISTVGVAGQISSRAEAAFLSLGVSRFCPAGRMQFPPLTWHHDGRNTLAELVTWIDAEGRA
jgi:hypothetical protein